MILVRNIFKLKFGQAKPAIAALKQSLTMMPRTDPNAPPRLLTDIVGTSYTVVLEIQYPNLASFEQEGQTLMGKPEWRAWYDTFVPYVESGSREIFNIVG